MEPPHIGRPLVRTIGTPVLKASAGNAPLTWTKICFPNYDFLRFLVAHLAPATHVWNLLAWLNLTQLRIWNLENFNLGPSIGQKSWTRLTFRFSLTITSSKSYHLILKCLLQKILNLEFLIISEKFWIIVSLMKKSDCLCPNDLCELNCLSLAC